MTIRNLLERAKTTYPDAVAIRYFENSHLCQITYQELWQRVLLLAEAIAALGVEPERDTLAIMLENRFEWIEFYLAAAGAGFTVVPLDPKLRGAEAAYILESSRSTLLFTHASHQALIESILPELPTMRHLVLLEERTGDANALQTVTCRTLASIREAVADKPHTWYQHHRPAPQTIASIIYTSGTTGQPRGVMLTHLNFCSNAVGSLEALEEALTRHDNFLIILPLFHSFSFTANFVIPLAGASAMSFARGVRTLGEDLRELRPTVLMAVPLLVEKLLERVQSRLERNPLTRWMQRLGLKSLLAMLTRHGLGGALRFIFVGGAPCPQHVVRSFRALGLPIVEGYGLTECAPVVSLTNFRSARPGTVGRKLPNIAVRIADPDAHGVGELQVRGSIVMQGYFQDLPATREVFDGEWLRTGDLASIDSAGYITIRGRLKALIVNREGKNIYPEEIEQAIAKNPLVGDVVVIGYRVNNLPGERVGCLIAPDLEAITDAAGGNEPPWPDVERAIRAAVRETCAGLADYKHPRKLVVRREPLERTSAQKVRRCLYQGQLDEEG